MTRWQIETDASAVADAACRAIGAAARDAIAARGSFSLVLAGGATPRETYGRLAASDQTWDGWQLYYGDERCLPVNDERRNSSMVEHSGLADKVGGHHRIPAELGPEPAATAYRERLADLPPFDVVLLGVGEDGHTASLFPGLAWSQDTVFAVHGAPKPPPERVTLGVEALQHCHKMLVLVAGAGKAEAVQRWRSGDDLPVARVSDIEQATILVDRAGMQLTTARASAT